MNYSHIKPINIVLFIGIAQLLSWLAFFPEDSFLPGIGNKYFTYSSVALFALLNIILISGIFIGGKSVRKNNPRVDIRYRTNTKLLVIATLIIGVFSCICELYYLYSILTSSAITSNDIINQGQVAEIKSIASGSVRYTTLATLGACVFASTAIGSSLLMSRASYLFRLQQINLALCGVICLMHSVVLSERTWIIMYVAILLASKLSYSVSFTVSKKLLSLLLSAILLFVYAAELSRTGLSISSRSGQNILSPEVLSFTLQRLVQAYSASEINNTLITLDCNFGPQYLASTALAPNFPNLKQPRECPFWTSNFGTMSITALSWFDLKYLSFIYLFICGFILGKSHQRNIEYIDYYYIASFSLIFASLININRTNSFMLYTFIIPVAVLKIAFLLSRKNNIEEIT